MRITRKFLKIFLETDLAGKSRRMQIHQIFKRSIHIQFFVLISATLLNAQEIKFTIDSKDESASNLPCYKIDTPSATYFLEKDGFGLSSLIDQDGNDWIGFSPEKGTGSSGEYRGFPNAVYNQDGSFFHPLNSKTEKAISNVMQVDSGKVTITGKSGNGTWECRWDFYMTHCTFTMTRMPDKYKYWVLYEGTPGGSYEDTDW